MLQDFGIQGFVTVDASLGAAFVSIVLPCSSWLWLTNFFLGSNNPTMKTEDSFWCNDRRAVCRVYGKLGASSVESRV